MFAECAEPCYLNWDENLCLLNVQSLVIPEKFQHILRIFNSNIDGRRKIMFAITAIRVCVIYFCFIKLLCHHSVISYILLNFLIRPVYFGLMSVFIILK